MLILLHSLNSYNIYIYSALKKVSPKVFLPFSEQPRGILTQNFTHLLLTCSYLRKRAEQHLLQSYGFFLRDTFAHSKTFLLSSGRHHLTSELWWLSGG